MKHNSAEQNTDRIRNFSYFKTISSDPTTFVIQGKETKKYVISSHHKPTLSPFPYLYTFSVESQAVPQSTKKQKNMVLQRISYTTEPQVYNEKPGPSRTTFSRPLKSCKILRVDLQFPSWMIFDNNSSCIDSSKS